MALIPSKVGLSRFNFPKIPRYSQEDEKLANLMKAQKNSDGWYVTATRQVDRRNQRMSQATPGLRDRLPEHLLTSLNSYSSAPGRERSQHTLTQAGVSPAWLLLPSPLLGQGSQPSSTSS